MLHKVNVNRDDEYHSKLFIDYTEIKGVRGIRYHEVVDEMPHMTLEIDLEAVDIDSLAKVDLELSVDSRMDAIHCLRLGMRLDKEFHDAVVASVASALIEHDNSEESVVDIAEAVVERVFYGELA